MRPAKIQHAGLVMGVRGLAGTAFHQRPADSTEHFNLAQSMRNVAALSAACLAMRRDDFVRVGGFDAVNTPIAHSDIDLCFKVREAGLRCVYTPFATLSHAGHVSIGVEEEKECARRRDKASIYLLKRWPHYTTHDPYFPDNMRDWLHSDSPTPIRMMAGNRPASLDSSPDLLFVSHDLSLSGAPMMLFHAATWCQRNGIFVLVIAPEDGPLREKLKAEGIPVIIDPLIETGHESFARTCAGLRLRHREHDSQRSGGSCVKGRECADCLVGARAGFGRRALSSRRHQTARRHASWRTCSLPLRRAPRQFIGAIPINR